MGRTLLSAAVDVVFDVDVEVDVDFDETSRSRPLQSFAKRPHNANLIDNDDFHRLIGRYEVLMTNL